MERNVKKKQLLISVAGVGSQPVTSSEDASEAKLICPFQPTSLKLPRFEVKGAAPLDVKAALVPPPPYQFPRLLLGRPPSPMMVSHDSDH